MPKEHFLYLRFSYLSFLDIFKRWLKKAGEIFPEGVLARFLAFENKWSGEKTERFAAHGARLDSQAPSTATMDGSDVLLRGRN